jgi:tetratricopeptide (TPR) repeat protein
MKLCPLISQASILDDKELLVHELDEPTPDRATDERQPQEENIFINPSSKPKDDTSLLDDLGIVREARFIAKSYRGQVECLGELCRFHDDEANMCRFERLLSGAGNGDGVSDGLDDLRTGIEKSWEFQQKSAGELLSLIRELEEKASAREGALRSGFDGKLSELVSLITSKTDETRGAMETITQALEATSSEIEGKISSEEKHFAQFRDEIAQWKGALQKNIDAMSADVDRNKKMVEELSENHTGIVALVEHQKKNLADEEKRRQLAEAKRLNNAGVMAYHNGQYERALGLFKKAIELDASFTEAYNNLGLTHTEMNNEEKATEAFRKAIELSPELSATYNNLGYVFYRLGSYDEAITMYNEAIGRSKDNSSAYTNLGNAYYKLDRIEEAVEAWKRALEIDPGNEKARRNLKRFHAEVR